MAALGFPVASKKVLESVAALFQRPQETQRTQPLCDGPIYLAILVAGAKLFGERGLTENFQKDLGLFEAPMHACCQK